MKNVRVIWINLLLQKNKLK